MAEPVGQVAEAVKAVANLANSIHAWHVKAQEVAKTDEERDAVRLVYSAFRLASAVAALEDEFRTMLNEIDKLNVGWSDEQRGQLAMQVKALGTKDSWVRQLVGATSFLAARERERGSWWRELILHFRGQRDDKLDDALDTLVSVGRRVLRFIGAEQPIETPAGVEQLVPKIWVADNQEAVEGAKAAATEAFGVIDLLTARSVHAAFEGFASVISQKHGLPTEGLPSVSTAAWPSVQ
jgi:hypothetical protein